MIPQSDLAAALTAVGIGAEDALRRFLGRMNDARLEPLNGGE
ncbi:hypothetical protein [Actinoplanes sp. HUAS TT8]